MSAYLGDASNKIISGKRNAELLITDWIDVKHAQTILKTGLNTQSKERCIELIQHLYKSVVQAHVDGQGFVRNATNIVLSWNSKADTSSLNLLGRLNIMQYARHIKGNLSNLQKWQYDFINRIIMKPDIVTVNIFGDEQVNYFWITILDDDTSAIMEYSKQYIDILSEYGSLNCDFMVFGKNEINNCQIPEDAISIIIKE